MLSRSAYLKFSLLILFLGWLIYLTSELFHSPAVTETIITISMALSPIDPSSYSRPDLAVVTNIYLNLTINFEKKIFEGNVDLSVKKIVPSVDEIILDAKNLKIDSIYENGINLKYELSEPKGEFGSKLVIKLPENKPDYTYVICINYHTSSESSGLQWLNREQTADRILPFVFSQFQPIHARSVLPCQDTPAVKMPYSAVIAVPSDVTAVMSAVRNGSKEMRGIRYFSFEQKIPVQSYLIAIAAGDLDSRQIGPRSHVWAERSVVEAAAYEFANTELQLKTAEEICGPYVWGIYDLLVLPPSFPFGGMENPCLTFVTPTLLAGDRSLANVVAHEIAHSWTGNLVTNKNFEHFWLNEGFTVFVERKIVGRLEGSKMQDFQAIGGLSALKETINALGITNPLTSLVVDLTGGVHPDDAFSNVPYEKGQIFLRYLEDVVGGPSVFEPFLREYFDKYKYKSVTTNDFKQFFLDKLGNIAATRDISWDTWLHAPGMPTVIPHYDDSLHKVCAEFKSQYLSWDEKSGASPFTNAEYLSANQKIQLLQEIFEEPPQSNGKLKALEPLLKLNETKNSEIKFRWLRICIKAGWEEKLDPALKWLTEVGRMKYVRPLYRDLYKAGGSVRQRAIDNFHAHRKYMMHVSAYTVAQDLQ